MNTEKIDTHHKALQINLDPSKYGTFAEIGAGQEVARWFFRVGGAAGTVAKAMSAYDMIVSDAIYGPCQRYVSKQRLLDMLNHEYALLHERLNAKRGASTRFFVFANTVAARSYSRQEDGQGWLGIQFQTEPGGEPSQIIIHVRLTDRENIAEQEALGIMGVNLIYGAIYLHDNPEALISSLADNVGTERAEVDMIKFSGPAFRHIDNRVMSLILVQKGLTNAAMFTANGENVHPADELYKKCILVQRGSFRPVTKVSMDILACSQAMFVQEAKVQGEDVMVLTEMTMNNLMAESGIDHKDFLERVDLLAALGKTVLISNYGEFYRLAAYLFRYTKKMIGIAMGVPTLREIFEEKYYADLGGGILESFGRLFKNDLKLYVYPLKDEKTGAIISAGNLQVATNLRSLYSYLLENRLIESLRGYDEECLSIFSRDILAKLRAGNPAWEGSVPPKVVSIIKERKLLGYGSLKPAAPAPAPALAVAST